MKIDEKYIGLLQILSKDVLSLDVSIENEYNEDTNLEMNEAIVDRQPTPEEKQITLDTSQQIKDMLKAYLSPKEEKIILMRFGFETGEPMTLEEIGDKFDVSRQAIQIVEARAMTKLKARIKKENLW